MTNKSNLNSPSIGYKGEVTYSIKKGNRILVSKKLCNSGTVNLFKVLCMALAGTPSQLSAPAKIQLFQKNMGESDYNRTDLHNLKISKDIVTNLGAALTPPLLYSNAPIIENKAGVPTITFQFVIPFSLISNPTAISYAILFPNKANMSVEADALAYLDFSKEDGYEDLSSQIPDTKEHAQFLVDWKMSFSNLSSEV